MKKSYLILRLSAVFLSSLMFPLISYSQEAKVYLSEGFEGGTMPKGWTENIVEGSLSWTYQAGGNYDLPPQAYHGSFNALLEPPVGSHNGGNTELVTNSLNLEGTDSSLVSFWYARGRKLGDDFSDYLEVLYKTSQDGEWILLGTIFDLCMDWTEYSFWIPKPSRNTYICFRGYAYFGVPGICLDDIEVKGYTPTYEGKVSHDYFNKNNWARNKCPADTDNVEIPNGCNFNPEIAEGRYAECRNLIGGYNYISKSGSSAAELRIKGNFTVLGVLDIMYPAKVVIDYGGALTVTDSTIIHSKPGIDSSLFIISDVGSFIPVKRKISYLPYDSTGTGYPVIYRGIDQDMPRWHYLSSPIINQEITNGDFAPVPGLFTSVPDTAYDFYKWIPVCPDPPYDAFWRNLRNTDGSQNVAEFGSPAYFEIGRGYLVSYMDWHENDLAFFNNGEKQFYGPLDSTFTGYNFSGVVSPGFSFWELIGNPFPSAFDWGKLTNKENLASNYYYIYDSYLPGGPGYDYWADSLHHSEFAYGIIQSMQGFFVEFLSAGGKYLGLPDTSRVHYNWGDLWSKNNSGKNKLSVILGNESYYDKTHVVFEPGGNTGKDRNDAIKMFSLSPEVPQVYTISDDNFKVAFNALPIPEGPVTVPVGFKVSTSGIYSLKIEGLENFSSLNGLVLEDRLMNASQNLFENPVYYFPSSGTEDDNRFLLHFAGPIGVNGNMSEEKIDIYSSGHTIYIHSSGSLLNAQVTVFNLLGQNILSKKLQNTSVNILDVENGEGYYIVKVQAGSRHNIGRVFIR
jgi:hypothetical protein